MSGNVTCPAASSPRPHLHHSPNVCNVRAGVRHSVVALRLPREGTAEVHGPRVSLDGLQPQHHGGGQLVVGIAALRLLLRGERDGGGQGSANDDWSDLPRALMLRRATSHTH